MLDTVAEYPSVLQYISVVFGMDMNEEDVRKELTDETRERNQEIRSLWLMRSFTWYSKSFSRTANGCRSIIVSN